MPGVVPTKWGALRKHPISAQDFRNPLLLALGMAAEFKPNRAVEFQNLYDPICQSMGISIEQYGKAENVSSYRVERWIQEAFKSLVAAGMAVRPQRGQWALTPNGSTRAQDLRGGTFPLDEEPEQNEVAVTPQKREDLYHPDPYIRALAVQETACFGLYSSASPTCEKCPMQQHCLNAMSAEMSRLKIELAIEDAKASGMPVPGTTEIPVEEKEPETTTPKFGAPKKIGRLIQTMQPAVCKKCGEEIPTGEDAYWIKSDRNQPETTPGMYHPRCNEES